MPADFVAYLLENEFKVSRHNLKIVSDKWYKHRIMDSLLEKKLQAKGPVSPVSARNTFFRYHST